jgi:hypothetical protein
LPLIGKVQIVQNFMDIAQRTGGDYCLLRRDRDCFRKMANYSSQYYLLTYYTEPAEISRWHKLHVTVHGNGLDVRARNGYFSAGKVGDPDERRRRDIAQAVAAPVEYRGLPFSVRWTYPDAKAVRENEASLEAQKSGLHPRRKQPFQIGLGPGSLTVDAANSNHIRLDFVALAMRRDGKVLSDSVQQIDLHPSAAELEQLQTTGFVYSNTIELPSAATSVKFIVRDDLSERIGTVFVPIENGVEPVR